MTTRQAVPFKIDGGTEPNTSVNRRQLSQRQRTLESPFDNVLGCTEPVPEIISDPSQAARMRPLTPSFGGGPAVWQRPGHQLIRVSRAIRRTAQQACRSIPSHGHIYLWHNVEPGKPQHFQIASARSQTQASVPYPARIIHLLNTLRVLKDNLCLRTVCNPLRRRGE